MNRFYSRMKFFVFILLYVFLSISLFAEYHHATFTMQFAQSNDRAVKTHRSNYDFSHSREYDCYGIFSSNKYRFNNYTVHDFRDHFRGYTESEILNERCLYMLDEFVKYAQIYSGYEDTI